MHPRLAAAVPARHRLPLAALVFVHQNYCQIAYCESIFSDRTPHRRPQAISVLDKHTVDCSKTNAHACTTCCRRYWFLGGGGVIELVLHRHVWYTPIFIAIWKAGVYLKQVARRKGHTCTTRVKAMAVVAIYCLLKDASSKPGEPSRDSRPVPNSLNAFL